MSVCSQSYNRREKLKVVKPFIIVGPKLPSSSNSPRIFRILPFIFCVVLILVIFWFPFFSPAIHFLINVYSHIADVLVKSQNRLFEIETTRREGNMLEFRMTLCRVWIVSEIPFCALLRAMDYHPDQIVRFVTNRSIDQLI